MLGGCKSWAYYCSRKRGRLPGGSSRSRHRQQIRDHQHGHLGRAWSEFPRLEESCRGDLENYSGQGLRYFCEEPTKTRGNDISGVANYQTRFIQFIHKAQRNVGTCQSWLLVAATATFCRQIRWLGFCNGSIHWKRY